MTLTLRPRKSAGSMVRAAMIAGVLLLTLAAAAPGTVSGQANAQVTSQAGGNTFQWTDAYSILQHPIPEADAQPWSIASSPNGVIWFVEQGTNQLGEYNPVTGAFTQHLIPTSRSSPDSVTSDGQGNIWFAELASNKLGELPSAGGNITEFPIPGVLVSLGASTQTLSCGPGAVLADPSGGVWVACLFSNQIDEFNPARGSFSSYDLPVFQSAPAGMVLDGRGDLWFTAADSNMLGKMVTSQLQNGTSSGITEFAPVNQTYPYRFNHGTSFLGGSEVITSSLGTPSGIALGPSGVLWVTEHVDSSFDSYDVAAQSLTKYWTTQTFGAFGYSVTFPNGIAVSPEGSVWIGEHYGNRIAELIPSTGTMTEYPVPCCTSAIAGVYSVALAPDGRLWFVEIGGDAIGEVVPNPAPAAVSLTLPHSSVALSPGGQVELPLSFAEASGNATALSLSVSGVTSTGALENLTAGFSRPTVELAPGGMGSSNLTLTDGNLGPGSYYLTLSATAQGGAIYSAILKVTISEGTSTPSTLLLAVAGVATVVAAVLGVLFGRRSQGGRAKRRPLRRPQARAAIRPPTPKPTAA